MKFSKTEIYIYEFNNASVWFDITWVFVIRLFVENFISLYFMMAS